MVKVQNLEFLIESVCRGKGNFVFSDGAANHFRFTGIFFENKDHCLID